MQSLIAASTMFPKHTHTFTFENLPSFGLSSFRKAAVKSDYLPRHVRPPVRPSVRP